MTIAFDNIVTVISGETDYVGKTGRVVGVYYGGYVIKPIRVRFYDQDIMHRLHSDGQRCIVSFNEEDLRIEKVWPIKNIVAELFGDTYDSMGVHHRKPNPRNGCEYLGCPEKESIGVLVNVSRKVTQIYVCDNHAHLNGQCLDKLPLKSTHEPAVIIQT